MQDLTPNQLHMMSHAVGHLKRNDRPRARARKLAECYRNYYCSERCAMWDDLVERKLAERHAGNAATGNDFVYRLTDSGFAVLAAHRAALVDDVERAKKRLRAFS